MTDLPREIPVFPLARVILLPGVQLPLNVFEPRYLALTRAALGAERLMGIVQAAPDGILPVGCAGRIVSFSETDDGRYLVTLKGVCRFRAGGAPVPDPEGFLRVTPDWSPYAADLGDEEAPSGLCRDSLAKVLRAYFALKGLTCEKWREMEGMSCGRLVSTLSVVLPFDAAEKQTLLEAASLPERARLLLSFLESAVSGRCGTEFSCH